MAQQLVAASSIIQELEEKLLEASRSQIAVRVTVAGLLHDLRNPLAVIGSCAQLSLEDQEPVCEVKEKFQMILENVKKANDLTKAFIDDAKSSVQYKKVNINETLTMIWKISKLQNSPCRVSLECDLDEDLPVIIGSQESLERVFLNIFVNSIQALSKNGKVQIKTRFLSAENVVEIAISDNGPGIPRNHHSLVFEPFYTTKENGTGLGLYISKSLILQHGGSIGFESQVGKGTAVSIRLPVYQEEFCRPKRNISPDYLAIF